MNELVSKPIVKKANQLITAKYKTSALENSIIAIATTRIIVTSEGLKAEITSSELTSILKLDRKNGYKKLKTAAASLPSHVVFIENPDKKEFLAFAMITEALYQKGNLTLRFNQRLTPFLSDLKGRYTKYVLSNYINLPSSTSQRLYEVLMKHTYKITPKNPRVEVVYNLSELKYMLGCLELDPLEFEKITSGKMTWADAESKVKTNSMKRWGNFKSRVLDRAKEEVVKYTEIDFEYEPYTRIKHGEITQVLFTITKQELNISEDFSAFIGHNGLTKDDIRILYKDTEGDVEKLKTAISIADNQSFVENYMGFLRSAIRKDWKPDVIQTLDGSKEEADRINAVKQDLFDAQKDPNGMFFVNMWNKALQKPEMQDFMAEFDSTDLDYFDLYSYRDKIDKFLEWKRNRLMIH